MMTRRDVLVATVTVASLAGCSATRRSSSPRAVCSASIEGGDDGSVFSLTPNVRSYGAGDDPLVELVIPIRQATVEAENVRQLVVFDSSEVLYRIPTSPDDDAVGATNRYDTDDVVEYAQSLGHVPQNGVYRVAALNAAGETLDEERIEFRCYRVSDEEPA